MRIVDNFFSLPSIWWRQRHDWKKERRLLELFYVVLFNKVVCSMHTRTCSSYSVLGSALRVFVSVYAFQVFTSVSLLFILCLFLFVHFLLVVVLGCQCSWLPANIRLQMIYLSSGCKMPHSLICMNICLTETLDLFESLVGMLNSIFFVIKARLFKTEY